MFQLTAKEFEHWRSQIVMSQPGARTALRRPPFAFTGHGAFVRMREVLATHKALARKLAPLRAARRLAGRNHRRHRSRPYVSSWPTRAQASTHRVRHSGREEARLNRNVRAKAGITAKAWELFQRGRSGNLTLTRISPKRANATLADLVRPHARLVTIGAVTLNPERDSVITSHLATANKQPLTA
jgi:hypothetical protein